MELFSLAGNIYRLSGPAPLLSHAFPSLSRPERAAKMDVIVTALASVTDGLIIQAYPLPFTYKKQHPSC